MKTLFILTTIFMATGCASIVQGTSQTIAFHLEPKHTRCVATRGDEGEIGTITYEKNTMEVSKSKNDIVLQCSAKGYAPKILQLVSSTQAIGVVSGMMWDAGIVDMATGAMWKYDDLIVISLDKI